MTIFATFMTRSGLIDSVHSFAENLLIAYWFLGFMGLIIVVGTVLIVWRAPELRSDRHIESFLSRESAFLFNNLIFLGAAFAVMWGTLFPLISQAFLGREIVVGAAFFNKVNVPIGLVLLALSGIGPVIAWRRASAKNLRRNFFIPLGVGLAVAAVLFAMGIRAWPALWTFGIGSFVLAVIAREFFKGTQARARIEGEGAPRALVHLVSRNRRRWGGYIVHVGIVIMFMGFAGSQFNNEVRDTMQPGDVALIESPLGHTYALTYQNLSYTQRDNPGSATPLFLEWVATFAVTKDGAPYDLMTATKRWYPTPGLMDPDRPGTPASEVGIHSTLMEDLYVVLETADGMAETRASEAQGITAKFLVNPLVGWVWFGSLVLAIGTVIALWPGGVVRDPEASSGGAPASSELAPAAG
jgi:cytochrome c-type biogenesis protein CcmF